MIELNCRLKSFDKYYSLQELKDYTAEIKDILKRDGIILLSGLDDKPKGLETAKLFGQIMGNLDATNHGITEITEAVAGQNTQNSRAFTRLNLFPHTDRSPLANPPELLLNWMLEPSKKGGYALFADGKAIYQHMLKNYPKYTALLFDKIATFTDSINTFIGGVFSINIHNEIEIRFRNDNCVIFDDIATNAIKKLKSIIKQHTIQVRLKAGEGYLLNNRRWLHGRTSYSGHRFICRTHLRTF